MWSSDVTSILLQPVVGGAKWFADGDLGTRARCRSSTNDAPTTTDLADVTTVIVVRPLLLRALRHRPPLRGTSHLRTRNGFEAEELRPKARRAERDCGERLDHAGALDAEARLPLCNYGEVIGDVAEDEEGPPITPAPRGVVKAPIA